MRRIFKIGNNGKTYSHAITIPKKFLDVLKINDNKLLVSLENNDDFNYIKLTKLDDASISESIKTYETKNNNEASKQNFESWD